MSKLSLSGRNVFSGRFRYLAAAVYLLGAGCSVQAPEPLDAVPSEAQMQWQKMEMNMFCHFGPNTFTAEEWGTGSEHANVFNPTDLDCRQWARTAKAAGFKGIIITAKHHDGFCLWPNPVSLHTVAQSSWRDGQGDVLRELSEACAEEGLKFGVYVSPWDRHDPHYGTSEYNDVFVSTLQSVHRNYGDIFEQWFDGACGEGPTGRRQVYDWPLFNATVYAEHPDAVIFSDVGPGCRWMGNERGVAGETSWSTISPEGFEPGAHAPAREVLNCGEADGSAWIPAETDVSIRPGWFYKDSENGKVKSLSQLLGIYYTSVGRNSLLLLNVPPDKRGHIHEIDSVRLMEFRAALDSIFSCNLASSAKVRASSVRGGSRRFAARNVLDDDYDSYWAADDGVCSATLELQLPEELCFNRIMLQEYIPLGQRVSRFHIEVLEGEGWRTVAEGTTIGYRRILLVDETRTSRIRVVIDAAKACPTLNGLGLFLDEIM